MSIRGRVFLVCAALLAAALLGACGGGDGPDVPEGAPAEAADFAEEWPTPNGD